MKYEDINTKADVFKFKSYDPFRERVHYSYNEYRSHTVYVNDTQHDCAYEDLPKEASSNADAYAYSLGLTVTEFNGAYSRRTVFEKEVGWEETDYCSLTQWMKGCKDE